MSNLTFSQYVMADLVLHQMRRVVYGDVGTVGVEAKKGSSGEVRALISVSVSHRWFIQVWTGPLYKTERVTRV